MMDVGGLISVIRDMLNYYKFDSIRFVLTMRNLEEERGIRGIFK